MRTLLFFAWLLPIAILGVSTSCSSADCDSRPDKIPSGTFVTDDYYPPERHDALHATDTGKTLSLDLDAQEVLLEYSDQEGRSVLETWTIGEIETGYD